MKEKHFIRDRYTNFIRVLEQLKTVLESFCYIFLGLNFGRKRIFHKGFILLLRGTWRRNVFWWGRSRVISISRFESLRRKKQSLLVLFSSGCCQRGDVPVWVNLHRSLFFSSCYTPDARTTANKSEEKPELSSETVKEGKGP